MASRLRHPESSDEARKTLEEFLEALQQELKKPSLATRARVDQLVGAVSDIVAACGVSPIIVVQPPAFIGGASRELDVIASWSVEWFGSSIRSWTLDIVNRAIGEVNRGVYDAFIEDRLRELVDDPPIGSPEPTIQETKPLPEPWWRTVDSVVTRATSVWYIALLPFRVIRIIARSHAKVRWTLGFLGLSILAFFATFVLLPAEATPNRVVISCTLAGLAVATASAIADRWERLT